MNLKRTRYVPNASLQVVCIHADSRPRCARRSWFPSEFPLVPPHGLDYSALHRDTQIWATRVFHFCFSPPNPEVIVIFMWNLPSSDELQCSRPRAFPFVSSKTLGPKTELHFRLMSSWIKAQAAAFVRMSLGPVVFAAIAAEERPQRYTI